MKDIKKIDEVAPELVVKKRKSPVGSIIYIAVGLAIALSKYFVPAVEASMNLSSAVMILGWSIVIFGFIKLVVVMTHSWDFYYKPTGEKMEMFDLSFGTSDKSKVCDYVKEGNFEKLAAIERSDVSSVKVSFYAVGKRSILWAQVFEFVPHTHEPVTDVLGFQLAQMPNGLVK